MIPRTLIVYYGILQSLHLLALIRAGILLGLGQTAPFPILPPADDWGAQAMPFLIGLGTTDFVGIIMGIIFALQLLIKGIYNRILGILSLTIFITGAIVFGFGTFPSGAWGLHPLAYWVMVGLFAPTTMLYSRLLQQAFRQSKQSQ